MKLPIGIRARWEEWGTAIPVLVCVLLAALAHGWYKWRNRS